MSSTFRLLHQRSIAGFNRSHGDQHDPATRLAHPRSPWSACLYVAGARPLLIRQLSFCLEGKRHALEQSGFGKIAHVGGGAS
jgi:hypothetical protein